MPDDGDAPAPPRAVLAELRVVPPDASLVLEGELDLHTVSQLRAALDAVVAAPVSRLYVDLGAVEFASLAALGELVDAAHVLGARDGCVVVREANALQRRVLDLLAAPESLVVVEPEVG